MDLDFTEEQLLLTQTVERFAKDQYGDGQRSSYLAMPLGFSPDNWRILAETGLLALPFSEDCGGLGGSATDLVCVMTALGKSVAVDPFLAGPVLTGRFLDRASGESDENGWAQRVIEGEAHLALAHAEKNARYQLDFVDTRFRETGGVAALTGSKTFVMASAPADAFIVSAIPEDTKQNGDRASHIRFFLVDANADGVTRRDYRLMDGSIASELSFSNAAGTAIGGGFTDLVDAVSLTKIGACAEMIGLMERLFEDTLEHLKTRKQFGQPLSAFQVLQHRMADLFASLELSRSQLYRMAAADPNEAGYAHTISGAKAYISEAAIKLGQECVQMHGGMGTTDELIIGHALKRIHVLAAMFGDPNTELENYA